MRFLIDFFAHVYDELGATKAKIGHQPVGLSPKIRTDALVFRYPTFVRAMHCSHPARGCIGRSNYIQKTEERSNTRRKKIANALLMSLACFATVTSSSAGQQSRVC